MYFICLVILRYRGDPLTEVVQTLSTSAAFHWFPPSAEMEAFASAASSSRSRFDTFLDTTGVLQPANSKGLKVLYAIIIILMIALILGIGFSIGESRCRYVESYLEKETSTLTSDTTTTGTPTLTDFIETEPQVNIQPLQVTSTSLPSEYSESSESSESSEFESEPEPEPEPEPEQQSKRSDLEKRSAPTEEPQCFSERVSSQECAPQNVFITWIVLRKYLIEHLKHNIGPPSVIYGTHMKVQRCLSFMNPCPNSVGDKLCFPSNEIYSTFNMTLYRRNNNQSKPFGNLLLTFVSHIECECKDTSEEKFKELDEPWYPPPILDAEFVYWKN